MTLCMAVTDSDPITFHSIGDVLCFSVNFDVQYDSTLASYTQCVRQAFHLMSARQYAHY